MALANTPQSFGAVARALHWLTALMILTAILLGLYSNSLPADSGAALAAKAQAFSLHKTLGVAVFVVALLRILWAFSQARPAALHPERRLETGVAEVVHWTLYIALLAVPLTGWVHHAAVSGFAPILWPLGQGLPFVPKSEGVAELAASLHWVFTKLLAAAILLHVVGALKHHLIDRDATLRRMLRGTAAPQSALPARHRATPLLAAFAVYAAGAGLAWSLVEPTAATDAPAPVAAAGGNWTVDEGSLTFTVAQMGTDVTGSFATWSADIRFDEASRSGTVRVTIDTTSLTLGSVTKSAKETEFFDVLTHPTAVFAADIAPAPGSADPTAHVADGRLTLRGVTLPVQLPFSLRIDAATATVTGAAELDRREFGMGKSYPDKASVGYVVPVTVALTATRKP